MAQPFADRGELNRIGSNMCRHIYWVILAAVSSVAAQAQTTPPPETGLAAERSGEVEKRRLFESFALTAKGDAEAGAKLFSDERTKCSVCHRVGKDGGRVGPDLTSIGNKYDRPHLVDAILYPSRQIGYGYETTKILTQSGQVFNGIAKESDATHVNLLNADNKIVRVAKADIETSKVSDTSIMPSGLEQTLSRNEFVDLVTYLESLGRGKGKHGSAISGPIRLPDGFRLSTVATGLSGAVAMDVAPDGRIFICVVYVSDSPYTHHRISRFRANGDVAVRGSEEILFRGDDQSKFGGNVPAGHQGGAIHFGPDGKLYVGIGDQTAGQPAQQMDALQGKILRLNRDGSIPSDNPFLDETIGKYRAIWAKGCRNPFTFAFGESGQMLINDVGGKFEEINLGIAGANYGWPVINHGPTNRDGFANPIHIYPQSSINGGDFCSPQSTWDSQLHGKYFFADFVEGWVKYIDPTSPKVSHDFLTGIRRPVDLRFGPDGSLYILLRNAWVVDDKFKGGTGSLVKVSRSTKTPSD